MASRLFANREKRDRVLGEFNRLTLDEVGPVGGEQGMRVVQQMNEPRAQEDEIFRDVGTG